MLRGKVAVSYGYESKRRAVDADGGGTLGRPAGVRLPAHRALNGPTSLLYRHGASLPDGKHRCQLRLR